MPTTTLTNTYTTEDEMDRLFSVQGVDLRTEDLDTNDRAQAIIDVIEDTTETFNSYLEAYYLDTDLKNSPWVRQRATYWACYLLSKRMDNAPNFADRRREILEELQQLAAGSALSGGLRIPRLATRGEHVPRMTNQHIDQWFHQQKLRTVSFISVGQSFTNQNIAHHIPYPFFWL